jgi:hypothetical protein
MTRFFFPTGKREKPFVPEDKWWNKMPLCLCAHGNCAHMNSKHPHLQGPCKVPGCGCTGFRKDERVVGIVSKVVYDSPY